LVEFAYLDPGSGSMLLQALLGGIAGLAVSMKLFGRRVLEFLRPGSHKEPEPPTPGTKEPR
jgi:hypothetical protein